VVETLGALGMADDFLNRYVGIVKETTYGTDPGSGYTYGEVDDESLQHRFDLMVRNDMSRPVASKAVTGKEYSEGDVSMAVQVDDFVGNLMYSFFPNDTVQTSDAPIYKHTLQEPTTTSDEWPSWTIKVGREEKMHTYTGMCTQSFNLSASVGEYVMLSVSFVGKAEGATAALITPTFDGDALDALYFSDGVVKFSSGSSLGAASATVKSISLDVNLNRDVDNSYALGSSTCVRMPPAQRREITGSIEFNEVIYGSGGPANEPSYDDLIAADGDDVTDGTNGALVLKFSSQDSVDEYMEIKLYHVFFEAPEANVSGRETNTMSCNFTGLYDAGTADKAMTVVLRSNGLKSSSY
tara:strand:- start:33410 stop:34468 length:1059 start_codon:yes stop_codon:yes gene_type:complete